MNTQTGLNPANITTNGPAHPSLRAIDTSVRACVNRMLDELYLAGIQPGPQDLEQLEREAVRWTDSRWDIFPAQLSLCLSVINGEALISGSRISLLSVHEAVDPASVSGTTALICRSPLAEGVMGAESLKVRIDFQASRAADARPGDGVYSVSVSEPWTDDDFVTDDGYAQALTRVLSVVRELIAHVISRPSPRLILRHGQWQPVQGTEQGHLWWPGMTHPERRVIVSAQIQKGQLIAQLSEESELRGLFYVDEDLHLLPEELLGLTMEEAGTLFCERDGQMLRRSAPVTHNSGR